MTWCITWMGQGTGSVVTAMPSSALFQAPRSCRDGWTRRLLRSLLAGAPHPQGEHPIPSHPPRSGFGAKPGYGLVRALTWGFAL
ncbi:hypothetical protein [Mycobacterium phage Maco6]|nr:hypothetical protein [Mycobacterium phage Maco6]